MTDLSPAAKAILDAYDNSPFDYDTGDFTACSAVLRAAADQLTPYSVAEMDGAAMARNKLLAIAAELNAAAAK
jgi:hypothetical protein